MRPWLCAMLVFAVLPASAQDGMPPADGEGQAAEVAAQVQEEASPVQSDETYGLEKSRAIEVCRPQGQRAYLARLVCPGGEHPAFERTGNVGMRHPLPEGMTDAEIEALLGDMRDLEKPPADGRDFHIVDAYVVDCSERQTTLYLDMYHCTVDRPTRAPAGFTIID